MSLDKIVNLNVPSNSPAFIKRFLEEEIKKRLPEGDYLFRALDSGRVEKVLLEGTDRESNGCSQPFDAIFIKETYGLDEDDWIYASPSLNIPIQFATENFLLEYLGSSERVKERAIVVYNSEDLKFLDNELGKDKTPKFIYGFKNPNNKRDSVVAIFKLK